MVRSQELYGIKVSEVVKHFIQSKVGNVFLHTTAVLKELIDITVHGFTPTRTAAD
jgi:hypothetical protein